MLTLFHSPQSRSGAILCLLEEMGIRDRIDVRVVSIPRVDGSGGRDPANPHPEGKVPALVHDRRVITERGADFFEECFDHILGFALVQPDFLEQKVSQLGFG